MRTIYDPACRHRRHALGRPTTTSSRLNPKAALDGLTARSSTPVLRDLQVRHDHQGPGRLDNIHLGNTFTDDGLRRPALRLPAVQPAVRRGVEEGREGGQATSTSSRASRDGSAPACPAINDGSLLFLQHMISKMQPVRRQGGSRAGHRLQRLAPVHRRGRVGRVRDPAVDHRERLAGGHRRAAGPAVLQHRHLHLLLDRHQPQVARAAGQGQLLDARELLREDAQVPRRQAQGASAPTRSTRSPGCYGEFTRRTEVKVFDNEEFGFHRELRSSDRSSWTSRRAKADRPTGWPVRAGPTCS